MDTSLRDFGREWEWYVISDTFTSFIFVVVFMVFIRTKKERANTSSNDICVNRGNYLIGLVYLQGPSVRGTWPENHCRPLIELRVHCPDNHRTHFVFLEVVKKC